MKTRVPASVLLVVALLWGCARAETLSATEVRPGVYMSNDPIDFPFPTSGYTVYIVGESHGNRETKLVFQAYLKKLYEKAGLRDVILEEDQAHEIEANAYIHGLSDELPSALCLRADILQQIREFNLNLPDEEKVTVHLVDVDSPLPIIYKHLAELYRQLGDKGESISFPDLSEFRGWNGKKMRKLIDEVRSVSTGQPDIINGLDTVSLSLEWYFLGNRLEIGWPRGTRAKFAPIREDVITNNIEYILKQLNGKPVLAFFGAAHGMKVMADPTFPVEGFKSWAERLVDENVEVYSLAMFGASGKSFWHERSLPSDEEFLREFKLTDGISLISLFDTYTIPDIVYTDLQAEENSTIRLSPDLLDVPASQLFDGVVIFRKFNPMENVCPK